MKKIKVLGLAMMVLLMSACGANYIRDTNPGAYEEITYEQLQSKLENDDTFYAMISQTTCGSCISFKQDVLTPYLEDHNITVYELNLTNEQSPKEIFDTLQEDYEDFVGTPHSLFVVEGTVKDQVVGPMSESDFDQLVVRHELDKKAE